MTVMLTLYKKIDLKTAYFFKFYHHDHKIFQNPILSSVSNAATSQVHTAVTLMLLTMRNYEVQRWSGLW
jgi:hypothetical protein